MKPLISLLISCALVVTASCQESRTVKVTVTEEDGTPIEGAQVSVWYMGYRPGESEEDKGNTDASGVFTANGTPLLRMEATISKEGYYTSRSGRLSRKIDHDVSFILRRVKNPIALHAKKTSLKLPLLEKPCGYDFLLGDWVGPHGRGKQAHCFFQMNTHVASMQNYDQNLIITFPNKGDGIMFVDVTEKNKLSAFKWFYEAPEAGYSEQMRFVQSRKKNKPLLNEFSSLSYALRVDTKLDQGGNVISAKYIRISKGLSFYGALSKSPGFKFKYYFNPTPNDRNLEFDPKKNLFKNLDSTERVHEP